MGHYLPYSVEVDGRWGPDHMLFGRIGAVRRYCQKAIDNGAEIITIRHHGYRVWDWDVTRAPRCRWQAHPVAPLMGLGEGLSSILTITASDDLSGWTETRLEMWCKNVALILYMALQPGWPEASYPRKSGPHTLEDFADCIDWKAATQAAGDLRLWLMLALWAREVLYPAYEAKKHKPHASAARVAWLIDNASTTLAPWMPLPDESAHYPSTINPTH